MLILETVVRVRREHAEGKSIKAIARDLRLSRKVGPDNIEVTDRAIDSHVKNLRRKLAQLLPDADVIQSVYGVGYRVEF